MQLSKLKNSFYYIIIISLLLACKGEDGAVGPSGLNSLIQTSTESAGSNCEFGGLKVDSGIDNNSNGILDSDEILKTDYVCSVAGDNSLVNIEDEDAGSNCTNGGIKIESGIDKDGNGTLDDSEVQITRFICNGIDGGFDEQIRLTIYSRNSGEFGNLGSTTGYIVGELINFDKRNWVGVDSIVFVPKFRTGNATYTAFTDLYDETNDVVINNSTVSTNSTSATHVISTNIFDDLPEQAIDLSIQLRIENSATTNWISGTSYIMLYRNN